jgi:hypothetical protein
LSETARDADGANDRAARIADQHAARRRDDAALGHIVERGEERLPLWLLGHAAGGAACRSASCYHRGVFEP